MGARTRAARGRVRAALRAWLPKLHYPIRSGEHSQTAFAFGLLQDWASRPATPECARLIDDRARSYYVADRDCPLAYEPSGEDFLSPCLAEADLMRRMLPPAQFAKWLSASCRGYRRMAAATGSRPAS